MYDQHRTKAELCEELAALRGRIAELEQAQAAPPYAGEQIPQQPPGSPDARERQRVEQVLTCQRRFFEQLAGGAPLADVLDILARCVESQSDGGLCSIMLLDEQGRHLLHGAAPSLPEAYTHAIHGSVIGPNAGSYGAAAWRGEPVIVANIASDPLWVNYQALALLHGLRACWSAPFSDSRGRVLGTLAVYYREPRAPTAAELEEVKQAAYRASVAVERTRAEQALRESEEAARTFQEQLKTLHRLSSELAAVASFDDLCRMAIELGCQRLGFDRLGLWFIDDDPRFKIGSYGIDEQGNLRDERGIRTRIGTSSLPEEQFFEAFPMHFDDDAELYNERGEVVGHGWNGMAALWDSERPIGFISADNLLSKRPASPYQMELLTLYASTLGYLVVRMRAALQLVQRIGERTMQLEAANKELEAFSYSVSHDLRAPLRHIDGFARLLAQREGDRLDETSARYLRVIGDAARKMGRLIDDLLAFSRMSRTEMQTRAVDLQQVVADVQHDLAPSTEGRAIDWQIGPLPIICGDPAMINVVFSNLLSNAVKYTAPRAQAQITIEATAGAGDEIVIAVRDNGVGFDMAYAHKLFGVFQRLHRDEEFEGTGIGLATVRRIINRHGGRAWATGALDGGATFYITLQRHKSEEADEENPAG
jgi:signal transduction histidine kinase